MVRKVRLFFVFVNLFLSVIVWAKDTEVYIIYRDTHGQMKEWIAELKHLREFGHVGFWFVYPDGSYKIFDCVPSRYSYNPFARIPPGVRKTTLKGFDSGKGVNFWVFDLNLTPSQTAQLEAWLKKQMGVLWSLAGYKGPEAYNCVGLVEAALESLHPKIDLTPGRVELFGLGLLPFTQLQCASKKLKRVEFNDLKDLKLKISPDEVKKILFK